MKKTARLTHLTSGLALMMSSHLMAANLPDNLMQAYQQGMQGDSAKNQFAIHALEKIYQASPNPVVLAMLGSAETTQARYTDQPWDKMTQAEKGLAKVDKAIKRAKNLPYDVRARVDITAGCTFAQVPTMMNRTEHSQYLLRHVMDQTEKFNALPPVLKATAERCLTLATQALNKVAPANTTKASEG